MAGLFVKRILIPFTLTGILFIIAVVSTVQATGRQTGLDERRISIIEFSAPQTVPNIQSNIASLTQFVSYDLQQAKLNTGKLFLRDLLFIWISK